jgi:BCD family chlorophyll transporter-like MFS transporter
MMDMTSAIHTGLFAGAWTLVSAVARGPASIAGGAVHSLLAAGGASQAQAYAGVFALEALGLLFALVLLGQVRVRRFRERVDSFGALAAQAMD